MTSRDPRKTFGAALTAAAARDDSIVAISVDSGLSSGLGGLRELHPERYIEIGIMEQAATGIAAGLATSGRIPVICAIAPFVTARNFEMFRNDLGYMRQNVKVVGRNGGMTYSQLGPTHHSLEDFALTRMIPGTAVLAPQDCGEIEAAVTAMLAHTGPVYMRIGAGQVPDLFPSGRFEIGKGRLITPGTHATVVSTGHVTAIVVEAVARLRREGIEIEHLGMPTIHPLDQALILESVARTGRILTIEEHYVRGGLGGAVAELLAEAYPVPHRILGVPHRFVPAGPYEELLRDCGLDVGSMVRSIGEFVTGP